MKGDFGAEKVRTFTVEDTSPGGSFHFWLWRISKRLYMKSISKSVGKCNALITLVGHVPFPLLKD
jgi:hypothetical protein